MRMGTSRIFFVGGDVRGCRRRYSDSGELLPPTPRLLAPATLVAPAPGPLLAPVGQRVAGRGGLGNRAGRRRRRSDNRRWGKKEETSEDPSDPGKVFYFKGTVQRDFRPLVFFIIRTCLGH